MSSATKKRVEEDDGQVKIQALFGLFFVITQFPSLITHYSSLITRNTTPVWHHHSISITQYFSHYLWVLYLSLIVGFSPNLVKKKRREKKPKKKKKRTEQIRRKEKKSQKLLKVATGTVCGSPFVCLITILPLNYELWKLKTAKMCFQFS